VLNVKVLQEERMAEREIQNAPPLYGWVIASGVGLVALGVSYLVLDLGANGSVAVAAIVAGVVGIIFTMADSPKASPAPKAQAAPAKPATNAAVPAPEAAPVIDAQPEPDVGSKPTALSAPMGEADDLKKISGVGPVLEGKLHSLGIYHFWQIARWTRDEVEWVDGFLNFKGRIDRDEWIVQANKLAQSSPAQPPA
jgi:predicted flap endonuclease-1-like 5' DNA nuclease